MSEDGVKNRYPVPKNSSVENRYHVEEDLLAGGMGMDAEETIQMLNTLAENGWELMGPPVLVADDVLRYYFRSTRYGM